MPIRRGHEGSLVPGAEHPQDNAKEFFDSFLTGLTADDWQARIESAAKKDQTDGMFLKNYSGTIEALQASISRSHEIPAHAPIHGLLKKRKAEVDRLMTGANSNAAPCIRLDDPEP